MLERLELSMERIREIPEEKRLMPAWDAYFASVAKFLIQAEENRRWVEQGNLKTADLQELERRNHKLYEDILPEHYENSYANPRYAVRCLGEEYGQLLSALYAEIRSILVYGYENRLEAITIRVELFLEFYGQALDAAAEGRLPEYEGLKESFYWFVSDNIEDLLAAEVSAQFDRKENWAGKLLDAADCDDLRYLYYYGEYVTEQERKLARYMNALPEETIALMADTYTEGYRKGFEVTRKDISIKKSVNVFYILGMERMVKKAMENFRTMGLEPILYRAPVSFLVGRRLYKSGYTGANANKQFEYDHEYDNSLYLNSKYVHRKLEAYKQALEANKTEAAWMGGPAVIGEFGEAAFVPQPKKENIKLTEVQQKLQAEYQGKARAILNQYVKGEERSFTIIAFPTPAIGEKFSEIFDETIRLNTLDYEVYSQCQQILIDVLDKAVAVHVEGTNGNHTNLQVALFSLEHPERETKFENCVADVNIPVGEVFTSPKLMGTNGILHVPRVFLNGLEYRELELTFEDGMIADYACKNFEMEEDNKKLIKEKLLGNRDTLPMGEFAIGTNTTAYVAAKRLQIQDVLPILIAEKTGPHFAIGDTCYSMEEDVASYNPDGKQIMSKDNECSILRKTDSSKAYYHCHTDITIPYDELAHITAVEADGTKHIILKNGRFMLKGLEELNKPFDE